MTIAAWVGIAVAWWLIRGEIARRRERQFTRTHVFGADGIVVGAEPVTLTGTRPGAVLLLHGYNDSPQSLHFIAAALHAGGWSVRVPLLPGHGRRLQDWAATNATEWENAARAELAELQSRARARSPSAVSPWAARSPSCWRRRIPRFGR